jgi:hypothetical protein
VRRHQVIIGYAVYAIVTRMLKYTLSRRARDAVGAVTPRRESRRSFIPLVAVAAAAAAGAAALLLRRRDQDEQ